MRRRSGTLIDVAAGVVLACAVAAIIPASVSAELVGQWELDDRSGEVASDSSGNGNDGVIGGDAKWTSGRVDGALELDGRQDVTVATASGDLQPATVTVAAWVKADPSAEGPSWIAGQGDNYGLVVNRLDDDSVFFYFYDGSDWRGVSSGDVGIRDGKWHHVAGVFDDAAKSLYVYKDGIRVGKERVDGPIRYHHDDGFTIGSKQGEHRFHGAVDDVRVYDHALSQAEMDRAALIASRQEGEPAEAVDEGTPIGVAFHTDTLFRSEGDGDNWRPAWAADDSQIVPMGDGSWLGIAFYHTHLYRVIGEPDDFTAEDIPNYPEFSGGRGSWFGYGVATVDGDIYSFVSKTPGKRWSGPFRGLKLLKSADEGETWYRVNRNGDERRLDPGDHARNSVSPKEMFFLEEFGLPHQKQEAYPFSFVEVVKSGKDNQAAQDDYLYIYSPEGAQAHKLLLARVPKEELGVRSAWEYFVAYEDGQPTWTSDIRQRGYAHIYPDKSQDGDAFGWYSWLPSVVWNEGLGLYIMVNGGTYAGHKMTASDDDYYDSWMHTRSGSLGFWYSENPYGPWHQFFYTDHWTVDSPRNRLYQPSLSPKWISDEGTEMVLIWSDAMKNEKGRSHTVNYVWNQMAVEILLK